MSVVVDEQYANIIGPRIEGFKITNRNPYTANMRCPFCGDSTKKKSKKRGYFHTKGDGIFYFCHNCGESHNMSGFLKEQDPDLHKRYNLEKFNFNNDFKWYDKKLNDSKEKMKKLADQAEVNFEALRELPTINKLSDDHPAVLYVKDRCIPKHMWSDISYTKNYMKWVNNTIVKKYDEDKIPLSDPRIVFVFRKKDGTPFAFQGRTIDPNNKLRYVTINESGLPTVFGLDRFNKNRLGYILEGPIDSMFLSNAIAVAGSSLNKFKNIKNDNLVFVFDNEPRNKDVLKIMEEVIEAGKKVVVWPEASIGLYKDINDMFKIYKSQREVEKLLEQYTIQGLKATLAFNQWKKI